MASIGLAMMRGKEMADEAMKRDAERAEWYRDSGLRAKRSQAEEAKLNDELSPERQHMVQMARQMEYKVAQNMAILDKHRGRMGTDPTAFADALNETHPQADGSKWVVDDKDGYANGLQLKLVGTDGTVLRDSGKTFANVTSGEHALMALQGAVQKPLEQLKDITGRRTAAAERDFKAWEKQGDWASKLEEAKYNLKGKLAEAQIQAGSQKYMADLLHNSNVMGKMPELMKSFVDFSLGQQNIHRAADGKYYSGSDPVADNDPRIVSAYKNAAVAARNYGAHVARGGNAMLAYPIMGGTTAGLPGAAPATALGLGFDPTANFKTGVNVNAGFGVTEPAGMFDSVMPSYSPEETALLNSLLPSSMQPSDKGVSQYNPYTGVPTSGRLDYTPNPMSNWFIPSGMSSDLTSFGQPLNNNKK